MWLSKENCDKKDKSNQLVAVAIDKDKGSQLALKWAIDNILHRSQTIALVHVKVKASHGPSSHIVLNGAQWDQQTKDLFLPFRCFCTRKDIQCRDIVLEDSDVQKALVEFVNQSVIEVLVMGAASKGSFLRFSKIDTPLAVSKGVPEFCTVYVISKSQKISSMRTASRPAPIVSQLKSQMFQQPISVPVSPSQLTSRKGSEKTTPFGSPYAGSDDIEYISTFTKGRQKHYGGDNIRGDTDISFVSTDERQSNANRVSTSSENDFSYESYTQRSSVEIPGFSPPPDSFSIASFDDNLSMNWSSIQSQSMYDMDHMKKLQRELKNSMYKSEDAHKEAITAKKKALELQKWKLEEEHKTTNASNAHKRLAEREAQKRINVEMKALKESGSMGKNMDSMNTSVRYRRYTIDEIEIATEYFTESRKIGEGGYGPVFRCHLDHTLVAVKVLRPDAAQGRSQFQQEVEVLSCIRHPNMVLLLGACPEYGCLVYEYMHNGSLEDRLLCRGGSPPLSWQHRFRIAAEIATGLLFLHQTKPEPLVHRDLKPGNILLDRNLVAKISDVGLARLVPPSVEDEVTQYRMTSTAGTFCYIDPEYQQTGMLGVKSDVYSLGIMLLQIITAKPPMGLAHHIERAIENGKFEDYLDPSVPDWPVEEALTFAKLSLQCAELRRRDRPDLGKVLLPELARLRNIAEESLDAILYGGGDDSYHISNSQVSIGQDGSAPASLESY